MLRRLVGRVNFIIDASMSPAVGGDVLDLISSSPGQTVGLEF